MTFVANCHDIFFPVPFPPSPFGFRRLTKAVVATFRVLLSFGKMLHDSHRAARISSISVAHSYPATFSSMHHRSRSQIASDRLSQPLMGQLVNRQSLLFSERGQLSQAIPQVHAERILHECTPIAQANRSTTKAGPMRTNFCLLGGKCDRQRKLVIGISAITLTRHSAITMARLRPSKIATSHRHFGSQELLQKELFFDVRLPLDCYRRFRVFQSLSDRPNRLHSSR